LLTAKNLYKNKKLEKNPEYIVVTIKICIIYFLKAIIYCILEQPPRNLSENTSPEKTTTAYGNF
jgi:hypothetical protein